jgi:hypothetical protein
MIYGQLINRGFELPVRFTYCEPCWLPVYYITVHLLGLISICLAELPLIISLILFIYVTSSLAIWVISRYCRTSHSRRLVINLNVQNEWSLQELGFQPVAANLVSTRILHAGLIFIKLKAATGRHYDLWLSGNTIGSDSLRRLRVRLLYPITSLSE